MLYNISDIQKVMGVKERMADFIQYKNMSKSKFERVCGLANGFVASIGDSIRPESLDRVSKMFPDLNRSWLMLGEGEMIRSGNLSEQNNDNPGNNSSTLVSREDGLNDLKVEARLLRERVNEVTDKYEAALRRIWTLEQEIRKKE